MTGARFLSERFDRTRPAGDVPIDDELLARWRAHAAGDSPERFARRLAWQGLDPDAAALALRGDGDGDDAGDGADEGPGHAPWREVMAELAAEARATVDLSCDEADPIPFEALWRPAGRVATRRLVKRCAPVRSAAAIQGAVLAALERGLVRRVARIADRVVERELLRHRGVGAELVLRLTPAASHPAQGTLRGFVGAHLADGYRGLFGRYPVLARLIAGAVSRWVEATAEWIERLAADRPALAGAFGELGPVVAADADLSDAHQGGRRVIGLGFASGIRILYKPRDLRIEAAYTALLAWCNRRLDDPAFRPHRVIVRDGYGWVEHVPSRPCASAQEVTRFFERAGFQLALLYALGAGDCHAENLIACGAFPVLVDMETLLQPVPPSLVEDGGHFDSVLRNGLLPRWECRYETTHLVDASGLGLAAEQRVRARQWARANQDDTVLVHGWTVLPAPRNVPVLDGRPIGPEAHADAVCRGFQAGYDFLCAHREPLSAAGGPLAAFRTATIRFIFRATRVYGMILEAALDPEALADGARFGIELERLAYAYTMAPERPRAWPLLGAEIAALERLDIPYFGGGADEAPLSVGLDAPADYFPETGWAAMCARLSRLGPDDRQLQLALVRSALATRGIPGHAAGIRAAPAEGRPRDGDPAVLQAEALRLAGALASSRLTVGGRPSWPGLVYIRNTERFHVNLLPANLYDGLCGVAVGLAAVAAVTGDPPARRLALEAIDPLRAEVRRRDRAERLVRRLGIGGGVGAGSLVYAFGAIGRLLGEAGPIEDALALISAIDARDVARDRAFDVMEGAAGLVLGLAAIDAQTSDPAARRLAVAAGEHLLAHQRPDGSWPWADTRTHSPGFAHGEAGVAAALARLAELTGADRFAEAAMAAFEAEDRKPAGTPVAMVSWCHGEAGMALARLASLPVLPALAGRARALVDATLAHGPTGIDSMCCGSFGRIEAAIEGARALGRPALLDAARGRAARLAGGPGYRVVGSFTGGSDGMSPTLFQGLAGIALQLSRLAAPDVVPSVLTWR